MTGGLRKDAEKYPVYHLLIVALLSVGIASLPIEDLFSLFMRDEKVCYLLCGIITRITVFVLAVVFTAKYGFNKTYTYKINKESVVLIISSLIVCINNFPIIACITGVKISATALETVLFIFYSISVALFEESVFRGIVFPLSFIKVKDKKYGVVLSCIITNATFSLIHLLNLFSGSGISAVILQVGYTFLVGSMFTIVLIKSGNIFVSVLLHTVFDIGGLFFDGRIGIASGNQWDTVTVTVTAIIGVAVCVYFVYTCFKVNPEQIKERYMID